MAERAKSQKPARFQADSFLERVSSGVSGLDEMIGGGFVRQSTALVRGGTGSGKTLLCLQYLYYGAMKYNEPGVYLSFAESESSIHQHGKIFGWDFKSLTAQNKFAVIRYQPHEIVKIIDEGGGVIRDTVESMGAKRLVIDSLTAYEMMFDTEYKANESILTLLEILRKWNTTALVTSESPITPLAVGRGRLGFLTDCILHLYYLRMGAHRRRALEVVKMRDTQHSDEVRIFDLAKNGLCISKRLGKLGK
ncbi:MAG: ATPase domain-containing protein [Candidatus Micrarchaeota archaeon]